MSGPPSAGVPGLSGSKPTVVIGGGVIGLNIAYCLANAGVPVEVIERHNLASGASWGNAGWVCASHSAPVPAPGVIHYALRSLGRPASPLYLRPLPDLSLIAWLLRFSRSTSAAAFARGYEALAELNRNTFALFESLHARRVDTTLRRVGMVHAFRSAAAARKFLQMQRAMAPGRYVVPYEIVEGADAAQLDPALSPQVRAGYLVAGEGVVQPTHLVAALAKAVTGLGCRIHEQMQAIGFRQDGRSVRAVRTPDGDLECSTVVVAGGTWSAALLAALGQRVPLQTGKGYSFLVDLDRPPEHALYLGERKIAVSPMNGTTRIAGTMELSGNNRRMDWRRISAIALGSRDYLGQWFDDPDDLITRIHDPWVGGRPLLPDGLPVIDRVTTTANAFIATGHAMLGVTLAPATGAALTEYILTGQRPAILQPFRIDRWST
jgi:glycine/D-amino acid oxidase-like deaminating enzyme